MSDIVVALGGFVLIWGLRSGLAPIVKGVVPWPDGASFLVRLEAWRWFLP